MKIVLNILCLIVLLTSNCFAEKLFDKDFTRQVAIDKFFMGRTIDPIEGTWYMDKNVEFTIVQKSLVSFQKDKEKYADCDYTVIRIKDGSIYAGLKKTDIPYVYDGVMSSKYSIIEWRLLAPRALQIGGPFSGLYGELRESGFKNDFLMRIYPET